MNKTQNAMVFASGVAVGIILIGLCLGVGESCRSVKPQTVYAPYRFETNLWQGPTNSVPMDWAICKYVAFSSISFTGYSDKRKDVSRFTSMIVSNATDHDVHVYLWPDITNLVSGDLKIPKGCIADLTFGQFPVTNEFQMLLFRAPESK